MIFHHAPRAHAELICASHNAVNAALLDIFMRRSGERMQHRRSRRRAAAILLYLNTVYYRHQNSPLGISDGKD